MQCTLIPSVKKGKKKNSDVAVHQIGFTSHSWVSAWSLKKMGRSWLITEFWGDFQRLVCWQGDCWENTNTRSASWDAHLPIGQVGQSITTRRHQTRQNFQNFKRSANFLCKILQCWKWQCFFSSQSYQAHYSFRSQVGNN